MSRGPRKAPPARRSLAELPDPCQPQELSQAVGVSRATIYAEIAAGRLRVTRIGSGDKRQMMLIRRSWIEDWLEGPRKEEQA
jgi:excisionase family DNA binding protein